MECAGAADIEVQYLEVRVCEKEGGCCIEPCGGRTAKVGQSERGELWPAAIEE